MNNELTFEAYMTAIDIDRPAGNSLRSADEWYRFYVFACEQVAKYGLDGSGIPIGATVIDANHASLYNNKKRGYNGIVSRQGKFLGVAETDKRFFVCNDGMSGMPVFWVNRSCWWRYLIVVEPVIS